MRSRTLGLKWLTALLTAGAPFAYGETEQVTVTDRRFDGAHTASPTRTLERKAIDEIGVTTTAEVLRKQPEFFSGSPSEAAAGGAASPNASFSQADTADLHGLGAGSTLVLVNGQRIAPSDFGGYIDLSLIPLSAVERIEIMSDGASAIYGADAVAGVVNIVLRDDFNGAATSARLGVAANGAAAETQISQLLGTSWGSGRLLANVEYRKRDALPSDERSFSREAPQPLDLLPEQESMSILLNGKQELSEGAEVFGHALWSKRQFDASINNDGGLLSTLQRGDAALWTVSGGVALQQDDIFRFEINGSLSKTTSDNNTVYLPGREMFNNTENTSVANSLEVKIDGEFWKTDAGDWRYVGGVQRRHDTYKSQRTDANARERRESLALYSEVQMPLVGPKSNRFGVSRLQLDMAARVERYSDVKGTISPKVGIVWAPVAPLAFRFTYGRSTRNPSFDEKDETSNAYVIMPMEDVASGNVVNVLALTGQDSHLQAEKATTWTTGADLKIPNVEGLSISASYFHINFRNRIASPLSGDLLPAGAGQGPYSKYVAWDPSVEQISMWTESPYFFLQEGQDPSQVDVIVDNRLKNIAATHVSGVDASVVYEWSARGVRVNGVLNGEYLAHHEQQVLAGEQVVSLRNTVFNPVARRARGGFTAERGGMAGGVFANYVDGYEDNRQAVNVGVGAMTTVDMSLSYSVGEARNAAAALENVTVGLNVFNVLNQRPPYVWDRVNHVNYDGANASALGRVVTVTVRKKW